MTTCQSKTFQQTIVQYVSFGRWFLKRQKAEGRDMFEFVEWFCGFFFMVKGYLSKGMGL